MAHELDANGRNVVWHFGGAVDGFEVDAFTEARRQEACEYRGARHAMRPCGDTALHEARGHTVVIHRPEDVLLNVFLARPDDLDRTLDFLRDAHRPFDLEDLEPSPERAAEQMVVDRHLLCGKPGHSCSRGLRAT